eukprot:SAG31_NODE_1383_length_8578_cov_3.660573_3_plen_149_part_00
MMQTVDNESTQGILSVGVPGTLAGWCHVLKHYGTMALKQVMGPAIQRAEHGFRVTGYLSNIIGNKISTIKQYPATAAVFLNKEGSPLQEGALLCATVLLDGSALSPSFPTMGAGELLVQSDLAKSYRLIATNGPSVLYGGQVVSTACV